MSDTGRTHTSSLAVLGALLFITARSLDSTGAPGIPASADPAKLSPTDRETLAEVESALTVQLENSGMSVTSTLAEVAAAVAYVRGRAEVPSLTASRYDKLRKSVLDGLGATSAQGATIWPPTSQTAVQRFGSWNEALKAAGLGDEQDRPSQGAAALRRGCLRQGDCRIPRRLRITRDRRDLQGLHRIRRRAQGRGALGRGRQEVLRKLEFSARRGGMRLLQAHRAGAKASNRSHAVLMVSSETAKHHAMPARCRVTDSEDSSPRWHCCRRACPSLPRIVQEAASPPGRSKPPVEAMVASSQAGVA
ncbi:homing endonuclease associated repeat-containing protein [Brevibacterium casei]|nr:hypothetical protein [Brevibacterium casei]